MSNTFNLSGLTDKSLENIVRTAVEKAGYSESEMADIRIPVKYDISDYILKSDALDNMLKKLFLWQKTAIIDCDIAIPQVNTLKAKAKRIMARFFRWYVVPMSTTQSCFNNEAAQIIFELASYLSKQEAVIAKMQRQIDIMESKNV